MADLTGATGATGAASAEAVALLALAYVELSDYSASGPRHGFANLIDDCEDGSEPSLLTCVASAAAEEIDFALARAMRGVEEDGSALRLPLLVPLDALRAE